jgi:hypothetical protein
MKNSSPLSVLLAPLFAARSYAVAPDSGAPQSFADAVGGLEPMPSAAQVLNGKEFKYFFKTPEIVVKDDEGKEISRSKGEKHPDVTAVLPVPTPEETITALSFYGETETVGEGKDAKQVSTLRGKVAQLIMDLIYDQVKDAGKMQINEALDKNSENPAFRFTANMFDLSKVTLEYISQLERGQRGAWAPSDEDLKSFCEDYTNIFVHEIQYDVKKVKVHCEQFTKGFAKIKADKLAVQKMLDFLTTWASKTTNMEVQSETYGWLRARANKYLKAEEKNYADAL